MNQTNPRACTRHDSQGAHTQDQAAAPVASRGVRGGVAPASLLACAWLLAAGLAAQGETLTDAARRDVTVPAGVERVIPAGVPAQILLQALAPGKLAGLVEPFKPGDSIFVDEAVANLPQIPVLTRTDAPGDVNSVAALKPGLVVDYGNVSARYAAADEKIQNELKTPTVLLNGDLLNVAAVVRTLGGALGVAARGEEIARIAGSVLDQLKPVSALPDVERIPVYLARGTDGLDAARAGTSFDEPIRLAGGRNVVTGTGGTFRQTTVAAVVALRPAVVIFAREEALHSPLRAALPKGTKFVLDAGEPYRVLTGAPSINRLAGTLALAGILHPDKVKLADGAAARVETSLFPLPPGVAEPTPLQVSE